MIDLRARAEKAMGENYKDAVLDRLGDSLNVAQFVSFGPDLSQRFSRIHGHPPNSGFPNPKAAVDALLKAAPEGLVNIRSFKPDSTKSSDFLLGFDNSNDVVMQLQRLSSGHFYTIVNETINMAGGVGGVLLGGLTEFAPNDTPRCVEKSGTASLPKHSATRMLRTVYRFEPKLDYDTDERVEFTIHLQRRGWLHEHTVIWELENVEPVKLEADIHWPNLFSEFLGDKAFGLLLADVMDLPVPLTTVISRGLPPFSFGQPTGTGETWLRTCPSRQEPGRFTSLRGWSDPFNVIQREDPQGMSLVAVLAQEAVEPVYSGALVTQPDGRPVIEGVRGAGDQFMLGQKAPEELPDPVVQSVRRLLNETQAKLGLVGLEWVYDGTVAWIVQVHSGATQTDGQDLFPGTADSFRQFDVRQGIEKLRKLIAEVQSTGEGIILIGSVGTTSHMGDILRKAQIPSRLHRA